MDFFKPPIVLIHGLWMTPLSWEYWIPYFEKEGFEVHAPGWPGVDGRTHEEIRADPKPISLHRIEDIVDHYETYIRKLAEPPIIIGHSFGGLFAQNTIIARTWRTWNRCVPCAASGDHLHFAKHNKNGDAHIHPPATLGRDSTDL